MFRHWSGRVALAACLLLFAAPLFVGLDRWDMRNDEAIYSFAVDRMLDTGDWVTPRYIPHDYEFLEKPPLKMWLVAGLMKLGVVPRTDAGMRVLDPIFGTAAFVYVFLLGSRLAGPACGATALLILFTFNPLIFDHGLRSNNMEAALLLAYAGGLWHSLRWADGGGRRQAWAASSYFVLGFMTKYVAVIFLPMVALAAWLWRPGGAGDLRRRWRAWMLPVATAVLVMAPWFVYESWRFGWFFWDQLLGEQVYRRFTTGVDPAHLAPWHFYFSQTWRELELAGTAWLVAAGTVGLLVLAIKGNRIARLLVLWWMIPISLISLGHSKLTHYVFPFLPPLAIAGGLVASALVTAGSVIGSFVAARLERWPLETLMRALTPYRRVLLGLGVTAIILAGWTALMGPVNVEAWGYRLFRNSTLFRPVVIAVILLALAGHARAIGAGAAAVAVVAVLPVVTYARHVDLVQSVDRPLGSLTDCIVTASARSGTPLPDVVVTDPAAISHTYFYYLRHLGEWLPEDGFMDQVRALSMDEPDDVMFLMHRSTWAAARSDLGLPPADIANGLSDSPLDVGIQFGGDEVLTVPARYRPCLGAVVAAGGRPITPDGGRP